MRTSTPRQAAAATAATVFREREGELKAEVMSGPEEEGEKAKGGVMAVKGPTVLPPSHSALV